MGYTTTLIVVLAICTQVTPQFISFDKNGKLGVNFGGYHAGVGIGGLLGGGGAGGLFAEAGTPFGQQAAAGLGGEYGHNGRTAGGLFAGATAGGGVNAAAGLSGATGDAGAAGGELYAGAQAGPKVAYSGLAGETQGAGSAGFSVTKTKSFQATSGISGGVQNQEIPTFVPLEKEVHVTKEKKVHKEFEENFVSPPAVENTVYVSQPAVEKTVHVSTPVVHKTVYVQQPAVFEKRVNYNVEAQAPVQTVQEVYVPAPVVYKRKRPHHLHKHAWIGGYVGAAAAPPAVVEKRVYVASQAPVIDKRIDVGAAGHSDVGIEAGGAHNVGYTKTVQVSAQRNPTFFSDIFNIPIQTLSAVGKFLGNAATGTSVSVQKSASVSAGGQVEKSYSSY